MKKDHIRNFLVLALIVSGLAILLFRNAPSNEAPEIEKMMSLESTAERSDALKELLERVGAVEAQELMVRSGFPFTGETHLLIHTVGDYIYDTYGPEGLPLCKDYFLSACYHGFIINTLGDYGMEGMADAMDRCNKEVPGVAVQCAHAAGHGFVAWHDYDLLKALEMCDELGERSDNFGHYNCYDGVFMENFWGIHNGEPSPKRWVKADDIYYPCTDPRIPEKYLGGCWANQATSIYQHYKGDLKKTALACDAVEEPHKSTCYNNFYRQIHPLTNGKKAKVFELCQNSTGEERYNECVLTNMSSYWSVGDRIIPFQICGSLAGEPQSRCLDRLVGLIEYRYGQEPDNRAFYCAKISDESKRERCEK